jgi:hypothetical protein
VLTDEVRANSSRSSWKRSALLQERNATSRSVIAWSVGAFLLFSLIVAGLLALFGRRDLHALSKSYSDILQHENEDTMPSCATRLAAHAARPSWPRKSDRPHSAWNRWPTPC